MLRRYLEKGCEYTIIIKKTIVLTLMNQKKTSLGQAPGKLQQVLV